MPSLDSVTMTASEARQAASDSDAWYTQTMGRGNRDA